MGEHLLLSFPVMVLHCTGPRRKGPETQEEARTVSESKTGHRAGVQAEQAEDENGSPAVLGQRLGEVLVECRRGQGRALWRLLLLDLFKTRSCPGPKISLAHASIWDPFEEKGQTLTRVLRHHLHRSLSVL